jgi:hypothetical protein
VTERWLQKAGVFEVGRKKTWFKEAFNEIELVYFFFARNFNKGLIQSL